MKDRNLMKRTFPTCRRLALPLLMLLAAGLTALGVIAAPALSELGKFRITIADWQCEAVINSLSAEATYALNPREPDDEDKFSVELEGMMRVQEYTGSVTVLDPAEIIAVSQDLQVTAAQTRLKADALKQKPRDLRNDPNYSPVLADGAEFRVRRVELNVPPHRVQSMTLRGSVLLAERREHVDLPAAVMDAAVEGPRGVKLTISAMSIRKGRTTRPDMLTMSIDWQQKQDIAAPALRDFPFVDQVFALDKDGRIIGGGRWDRGDPLNESGTFKFEIALPVNATCETIRVDLVTKYSEQQFDLAVEDIFDPREQ